MIQAGAGALQDLQALAVAMGGFGDKVFELFLGYQARAGAGHEEGTGLSELQGEHVEVVVFF